MSEEAVIEDFEATFEDLGYHVVGRVYDYRLEATVYHVFAMRKADGSLENQENGRPLFVDKIRSAPVNDINDAEVALTGFVKWDGCSDWSLFGNSGCMTHFCTRKGLVEFGELLARIFDLSAQKIPHWSG